MASILLSYVDSDKAAAKALARSLEGAHHTAYGYLTVHRTHTDGRSRESVDCIILVWSAAAVVSPHVYEDARIALRRNKLVQVFVSGFDQSTLPPVYARREGRLCRTTNGMK